MKINLPIFCAIVIIFLWKCPNTGRMEVASVEKEEVTLLEITCSSPIISARYPNCNPAEHRVFRTNYLVPVLLRNKSKSRLSICLSADTSLIYASKCSMVSTKKDTLLTGLGEPLCWRKQLLYPNECINLYTPIYYSSQDGILAEIVLEYAFYFEEFPYIPPQVKRQTVAHYARLTLHKDVRFLPLPKPLCE
jgi:hypothetical protein